MGRSNIRHGGMSAARPWTRSDDGSDDELFAAGAHAVWLLRVVCDDVARSDAAVAVRAGNGALPGDDDEQHGGRARMYGHFLPGFDAEHDDARVGGVVHERGGWPVGMACDRLGR